MGDSHRPHRTVRTPASSLALCNTLVSRPQKIIGIVALSPMESTPADTKPLIAQQTTRFLSHEGGVLPWMSLHSAGRLYPGRNRTEDRGERDATIRLQAWLKARGNDRYRTDLEEERVIWLLSVWTSILLFIDPGTHVPAVELAPAGHARCQ